MARSRLDAWSKAWGQQLEVTCDGQAAGRPAAARQIDNPTSPSSTDVFNFGRSPLFHSAAVCTTR